ncbi:MAG: hypothetical protein M3271_03710 [Actinomycetota bacterium]|nr:hypothetical protein [Actinomycetota bacterium]
MEHRTPTRALAAAIGLALLSSAGPVAAQFDRRERARVATRFLADRQREDGSISLFSPLGDTADAVAAMVLARRGVRQIERAVGYLETHLDDATTVGLVAKVVLAAVSAGEDPRAFGGRDLVQEIHDAETAEGQLGGESDAEVTYHALAMLALSAAGEDPSEQNAAWLTAAQCADGGWQFDEPVSPTDDEHCRDSSGSDFAGSDTNTTSYAVQALRVAPGPDALHDPVEFLRSARDPFKKGLVYDPMQKCTEETLGEGCFLTDSNSTALGIQALIALEEPLPDRKIRALHRLQYPLCGRKGGGVAFTWEYDPATERFERQEPNVGSTIAAIPALLYHVFPLNHRTVTKPPPRRVPCS